MSMTGKIISKRQEKGVVDDKTNECLNQFSATEGRPRVNTQLAIRSLVEGSAHLLGSR